VWLNGGHLGFIGGTANAAMNLSALDWVGSVRTRVDPSGNIISADRNLPFGEGQTEFISGWGDQDDTIHFTGKERDAESGLDNFGARYYSSTMGRFMSPDWSAVISPVPFGHLENPQSLNLYAYVGNNPMSRTDPDGHECTVDGEKHGGLWCFGQALGVVQTKVEQIRDARFYENQYWSEQGVAPKNRPQLTNEQVLNAYHNGGFARPDNDIEKMEAGIIGGASVFRGGSSLIARAMDVKIDPATGLLNTNRGISLSTDPNSLARFGGANEIESIPEQLEIKQVGQNADHYELTPKQPMTMEQYQNLLNQVKFK
jgi:RHS repeat-associated protein